MAIADYDYLFKMLMVAETGVQRGFMTLIELFRLESRPSSCDMQTILLQTLISPL
jgi:hypothetical protein